MAYSIFCLDKDNVPPQAGELDSIRTLFKEDPKAAIKLAEPLWAEENHPQRLEIGLLLVENHVRTKEHRKRLMITSKLLELSDLSAEEEGPIPKI